MFVADAQVHIWEADRADRPWGRGLRPPQREKPFTQADLLEEMSKAKVDRAILVPPSWVGNSNATVLEAAQEHPDRFAVVGRFPVESPDRKQLIERWMSSPHMLGMRLTFITDEEKALMKDGAGEDIWSAAERHNVPIMLYPYDDLPQLAKIAGAHPDLRLIIDHMAARREKDERAFSNLNELLALAKFPNVAVKASALPHYSTEPYPYRGIHEKIRRVVDAFGPSRVFWGTDFTRLPCTYRQAVTMFTEELSFLSSDDKALIMGRGLCEWLRWPVNNTNTAAS